MELLCKVGNKYPKGHPSHITGWRDGQIVDIRQDGFSNGSMMKKGFCVIQTPKDYWFERGSNNWKSTGQKVFGLKKFLCPVDSLGKQAWEIGAKTDEKALRKRDWFVDFKFLLDMGWITQSVFESIYDRDKDHQTVNINRDLYSYLFHEDVKLRRVSPYSDNLASVATGTFSIGSGLDYATITAFEADIAATMTGNLTGEHNDEESAISATVKFDTDTATFLLKLTAQAGDEHNGGAYGNGARIAFSTFDRIDFNETTGGHLADVEVSKLALDASANGDTGLNLNDCGDSGLVTVNRMLIKGSNVTTKGLVVDSACTNSSIRNNIIYGVGEAANDTGIRLANVGSGDTHVLYNNSIMKCYEGITQDATSLNGTLTVKNNLVQGSGVGGSFRDDGGGFGTSALNYAEDANSPDSLQETMHDGTSNFVDYANDNYLMASGGDFIDTLKAGEDLTGTFSDDIIGNTRLAATFFIGASWIVVAAAGGNPLNYGSLGLTGVGI